MISRFIDHLETELESRYAYGVLIPSKISAFPNGTSELLDPVDRFLLTENLMYHTILDNWECCTGFGKFREPSIADGPMKESMSFMSKKNMNWD